MPPAKAVRRKTKESRATTLTFVVGKGGVGKTTVSSAYALNLAARNPRSSVLLMSTDPAHSVADILQIKLHDEPRRVTKAKGRLSVWQINSDLAFRKFLASYRDAILDIVENGTFFSREEIAPLLDTTLPGMAEVAGLLAIQELLEKGEHDHIVVDTAPFGHTLRLFELPAHFQRFLNFLNVAASRDAVLAQSFGGHTVLPSHAFITRWEAMVKQVRDAFRSEQAEIFLVTSPETFSLNEAVRSLNILDESAHELRVTSIIVNRVVEAAGAKTCLRCRRRAQMARKARQFLKRNFPRIPVLTGPDPGNPILGVELLRHFGEKVFQDKAVRLEKKLPLERGQNLKFSRLPWPSAETPLSFTVGKGGVGKTTITAALAFHARVTHPQAAVTVCSTDPAPSLDDIFEKSIGNQPAPVLGDAKFTALEMDSVAEFRHWAATIKRKLMSEMSMESGGLHVDLTFEKQIFAALMDIVPPGVDEMFAIFRILDLVTGDAGKGRAGKVLIDMAPTGHALELLRMPERILLWSRLLLKSLAGHRTLALAQDVAVELASLGQQVRKLIEIMKDSAQSRVWAVMLAEPLPDGQTLRLLRSVSEIGIAVDSLFVNRVLLDPKAGACARCGRAQQWQSAILKSLRKRYKQYHIYVAPELPGEIAGAAALKKFTAELWQIAR
jgi:arsenite-transporting ATPase